MEYVQRRRVLRKVRRVLQASDKHAAYQETLRFVVQSLASVAYQINGLSYNMQQMLHAQADKVDQMTQQVDNIGQVP